MQPVCPNSHGDKTMNQTVAFLKAISDENRLKIICFLKGREKCVCEIVELLNLPQNLVSHHLKVLRENELVFARKDGVKVFYALNEKKITQITDFLNSLT